VISVSISKPSDLRSRLSSEQRRKAQKPVAKIGQLATIQDVDCDEQRSVAGPAQDGDIARPTPRHESRALDQIESVVEIPEKMRNLLGRHAAVGIYHDDNVAGRGQEARSECGAFSRDVLAQDANVRAAIHRHGHRGVG
jgi:hypothetical protein